MLQQIHISFRIELFKTHLLLHTAHWISFIHLNLTRQYNVSSMPLFNSKFNLRQSQHLLFFARKFSHVVASNFREKCENNLVLTWSCWRGRRCRLFSSPDGRARPQARTTPPGRTKKIYLDIFSVKYSPKNMPCNGITYSFQDFLMKPFF